MKRKKILILVMTCALPYYRKKEKSIRETWAKPILDGKEENVDLWFFNSGEKNCHDEKTHRIFVEVDDRRDRTFQKLAKTLEYVDGIPEIFRYDYICRVNISTVLNVERLKEFVDWLKDDNEIWSSTTFNQNWVAEEAPFFSGECFILSKKNINVVKNFYDGRREYFNHLEGMPLSSKLLATDDGWLTIIFHDYFGEDYEKYFHTFGIVYEALPELRFQEKYSSHIAITHKTDYIKGMDSTTELDKLPIFEEIDKKKRENVWNYLCNHKYVCENGKRWIDDFKENIMDKECRLSKKRDDDVFCSKSEIFNNWKTVKS